MQRHLRKWGALAIAAAMALGLMGCGGGTDAQALMEQARQNMQSVNSMQMKMTMNMDMAAMGQSAQMDMVADMAVVQSPMQMRIEMQVSGMGESEQVQMYAKQTDGTLMMYMNDGTGWQAGETTETELQSQMQQADAQNYMNTFIEAATSYKAVGSETVNGVNAEKIECTIKADALATAIMASGLEEQMSLEGADAEAVESIFEGVDDLVFTVWVEPEAAHVVKMEMDMTQLMAQVMENLIKQAAGEQAEALSGMIEINALKVTIDISDINAISEIEIPQEALDAA